MFLRQLPEQPRGPEDSIRPSQKLDSLAKRKVPQDLPKAPWREASSRGGGAELVTLIRADARSILSPFWATWPLDIPLKA